MPTDKTSTFDDVIAELRDGMTIGIGGWGSRRKPMALVRALARSEVKDLTVVTYGGPDLGLLCAAGKVRRAYYGFVSLDSAPFYDPWFAKARTNGEIEVREMDEGMVKCGLEAAAARVPFLPIRAGLGSDVLNFWEGELKTVTSPYPDADGRTQTLVAMPALKLDAAFVHLDLADAHGNAAYTGVDPYFDDLYCAAAERRYLEADQIVSTEVLVKTVPHQRLLLNRMAVDRVVHAPNGAHFTFAGEYGRDEKFQQFYVASAKEPETWDAFSRRFLQVDEQTYQREVTAWQDEQKETGQ
ncbi:acyl CoA--acetate/3-ketoacid CoA transferase subunit alpha [Gordonia sp. JH63]|uniref:CoA-transferase n=1 Tax=Gordonia hongkongensis TaxID=1701090 RepID=A0AAX3T4Y1_9ACTN|nr:MULTISPECIES: CoA-transferase [Gordonia]QIK46774.1 CoA transferase subunit A [Gordonia terrae]KSU51086.1 CoA-transferase [Gordonia sp. SGD-V-85]MBR7194006.1 CoA transferase subunit A [Gordonia sp. SCSIO 19800]QHD87199.1 acyl CoA--acetate/3-ketoacid CoA transferase subunit alpha [Gordonia sp. JH63]UPG67573.1 CoA transferase subunit A [Gordonia hongkongensis]